jgi:hypothetical protein
MFPLCFAKVNNCNDEGLISFCQYIKNIADHNKTDSEYNKESDKLKKETLFTKETFQVIHKMRFAKAAIVIFLNYSLNIIIRLI